MSQSTLDDDLFDEAASEVRADVEANLRRAREALPAADDVWEVDADNTLGALNALRSALDVGDAADHLRDAKKWYAMGERADAFEDADDLAAAIEETDDLLASVEDAREQVSDLASTVPQLRSALEDAEAELAEDGGDGDGEASSDGGGSDGSEETAADGGGEAEADGEDGAED